MADEVVNARNEVANVLNRFQYLVNYVNNLIEEMVDLDLLQQIRDLLTTTMNGLDANDLLHPADPLLADPALDDPADPHLADPEAQAADPIILISDDETQGSNSDED